MSQSITLVKLPEQILDDIASYLDRSTAYALCLVSRALLWPARRALYHTISLPARVPSESFALGRWFRIYRSVTASPHLARMIRKIVYTCPSEQTEEAVGYVLWTIEKAKSLQQLHWGAALDFLPDAEEVLSTLHEASFPSFTLLVAKWHPRSIIPTRPLSVLTLKQGPWSGSIDLSTVLAPHGHRKEPLEVGKLILLDIGEYYGDAVDMTGLLDFVKPPGSIRLEGCHLDWKAFATLLAWAGSSLATLVVNDCKFHNVDSAWDPFPDQPVTPYSDQMLRLQSFETDILAYPVVNIPTVTNLRVTRINAANFAELPGWLSRGTSLQILDFRQSTRDQKECPSVEAVQMVDDLAKRQSVTVLPEDFLKEVASWAIRQMDLNEQKVLAELAAKEAWRQNIKGSGLLDDDFPLNLFDLPDEE